MIRLCAAVAVVALHVTPAAVPLQPCVSDDGSGPLPCVWHADTAGNGQGTSFWVDKAGALHLFDGQQRTR